MYKTNNNRPTSKGEPFSPLSLIHSSSLVLLCSFLSILCLKFQLIILQTTPQISNLLPDISFPVIPDDVLEGKDLPSFLPLFSRITYNITDVVIIITAIVMITILYGLILL
jgi:hypothetical protein